MHHSSNALALKPNFTPEDEQLLVKEAINLIITSTTIKDIRFFCNDARNFAENPRTSLWSDGMLKGSFKNSMWYIRCYRRILLSDIPMVPPNRNNSYKCTWIH